MSSMITKFRKETLGFTGPMEKRHGAHALYYCKVCGVGDRGGRERRQVGGGRWEAQRGWVSAGGGCTVQGGDAWGHRANGACSPEACQHLFPPHTGTLELHLEHFSGRAAHGRWICTLPSEPGGGSSLSFLMSFCSPCPLTHTDTLELHLEPLACGAAHGLTHSLLSA